LRRGLLVATALFHGGVTAACWHQKPAPLLSGALGLDSLGLVFLSLVSLLFFAASLYSVSYLSAEKAEVHEDFVETNVFFSNSPEAVFTGCLSFFLATMSLVTVSRHLGLLWVAVEATTLASAPLIYFHRHHRSLEATWKYLILCSVGIALALLGNFLMAVAATTSGGIAITTLQLEDLLAHASALQPTWLKGAFLFFLVGYGTKMGLAPLHTWLPDAHSESPSVVSALLSGALLNCAFLGLLRVFSVCDTAGLGPFARELFLGMGLLSMAVAAVFILGQPDYKRMLAYSSVEHMGILAVGVGLGAGASFAVLFHAINHSLTKAALFLAAGNILAATKTKSVEDVKGLLKSLPFSGFLWMAGFFSIVGCPPFGTFMSELLILKSALDSGKILVAVLYLLLLALVFIGMALIFTQMAQGEPAIPPGAEKEKPASLVPPLLLIGLVLLLGLYMPPALSNLLQDASKSLSGSPVGENQKVVSKTTPHPDPLPQGAREPWPVVSYSPSPLTGEGQGEGETKKGGLP
jgi:hydrogenase-4 component F